ncbi:hypothetical protein HOLleu_04717 [Holothuria leucospilota]|uniref:Uncharacterized protein n=1 Tax=Holothuria leucospilota TaxID=206669 RepID=A0A9Q1HIH2_HOLLE|nr:hypothetical protein HOLleu_04717 [Holothuria leucospilota]
MLLPTPTTSNEAFSQQVLGKMNNDNVGLTVRKDDLICKFGLKLFMKFAEPHQFQYCAQRMRQLGRLVMTMKGLFPGKISSLKDAIHPQNFCDVVEAVRQTAGFNPISKQYKTPSLALQIGFSLRAVAGILKGEALKTGDKSEQEAAECFDKLCGLEWSQEVSHNAIMTLEKRKFNKPQMLPLGEDVVKLSRHLREISKKHSEILHANSSDNGAWYILAKATLAQLILFNRRRSGEVERVLLEECNNITSELNEDVLSSLSKWEQSLCKKLKRLEIRGKRGRRVPILMTEALHCNVQKLIFTRKDVDISDTNIYLFARPFPSQHPIRGQDCIRQYSVECGVSHPENITSTRLRKQIGTLSQVFNLQDNELDILATFMGHDIAVHRNYYRLPEQTLQLVKVSRILLAMDSGQTLDFNGKSLDEIEINIDGKFTFSCFPLERCRPQTSYIWAEDHENKLVATV